MAVTIVRQVFADIESTRETWLFAGATAAHVAVVQQGRAAVTLSGTPGAVKPTVTLADGTTISNVPQPNNGQSALKSSVHTTGTFEGAVVGASGATTQNTPVYITTAGDLTLTSGGSNVLWGVVNLPDGYVVRGTVIPVKIGA